MRLDAISIGRDPPQEVNVVVEVPVGGEPIIAVPVPRKWVKVLGWGDAEEARALIVAAIERAKGA